MTLMEAVYLSHHLNIMLGQRVRQEVIQQAIEVTERVREIKSGGKMDDLGEEFAEKYRQAHILCPLNELGQCLLFENRPVACRLFDLPFEERREVTLQLQQGLARLSREVWFAFTSSFPGNTSLTFFLSEVVSGKFVQSFFHRLIQGQ
jgi:Fe-S-cluster containining protein